MYIYKITNTTNNKKYIGQSVPDHNKRMTNHRYELNKGIHKNRHLQSAWNKYGGSQFLFEKIDFAKDFVELDQLEAYYIKKFKSNDRRYGYNIRGGGQLVHICAEETKQKISAANKGHHHTKAQRAKWAKEKRINNYPTHIISPTGRKYKVINIREFCRKHDMDKGNLMHVLKGKSLHIKGWHLETTPKELCNNGYASSVRQRQMEYLPLMSPDGKIHTIDTALAEFCRVHNLGTAHVRQLFKRTRHHHQGWRLANV